MKTTVVVNPNAAGLRDPKQWPKVKAAIQNTIAGKLIFEHTQAADHATELVRLALQHGSEKIIAVGGDGTVHECINGFFENEKLINPQATLGCIMMGTGCDFRKSLGIERGYEPAINAIVDGKTKTIDIGRLSYIDHQGCEMVGFFNNLASFGMGGAVDMAVADNRWAKKLGGKFAYLWASAKVLFTFRNPQLTIRIDGQTLYSGRSKLGVVANGKYGGGGMFFAPDAELDDGLFDVVLFRDLSISDILRNFVKIYSGTHIDGEQVTHHRGACVEVDSDETILLDIDGEALGSAPVKFEVMPGKVRVFVGTL